MRDCKLEDSHYIKFFIVLGVNVSMTYVCVHLNTRLCVLENLSLMSGVFPKGKCKPFEIEFLIIVMGMLAESSHLSALDLPDLCCRYVMS